MMLYPVTNIRYCGGGAIYRVRYKGNRAVGVEIPREHAPTYRYADVYEFDQAAHGRVLLAIEQHEEALAESRRLG